MPTDELETQLPTADAAVPSAGEAATAPPPRVRKLGRLEPVALPLVWLGIVVLFSILKPHEFLTSANLDSILSSQAPLVVVSLGLMIVLMAGDFDLSIAAVLSLTAMIIAILNVNHGFAIIPAILIALACATVVGAINGFIIVVLGVDSFITTLAMGTLVQGVVLWISGSNTFTGVSHDLVSVVIVDRLFSVPLEFYFALLVAVVLWYVLRYMPIGRRLLVVGRSRDVARLSGIRVGAIRWGALIATSLIAGLGGILYVGTSGAAGPSSGLELLLPAFAGAFLGATTVQPGRVNPWGTVIAVYFLVTGITGLELLGAQPYVQDLFYGVTLVLAVAFSQALRRGRLQKGI
jgi:ribose transport system permease protein